MAKSIETSAKTIDEAVNDGLEQLGASYEDVDVEIISGGGMFKKAKVKLTLKEGVKIEPEVKTEVKQETPTPAPVKIEETKIETKSEVARTEQTQKPIPQKPVPQKTPATPISAGSSAKLDACVDFVTKILAGLENDATISCETNDRGYIINISGEDVGRLIGKGGEALNALQTLVSSIAINNAKGDNKRVYVNIENYHEKRTDTLKALAQKKAEYVLRTGKRITLEPMTARERAIIHTAVQEITGVKSYSFGEGVNRRLCIAVDNGESKK
ncbi:MAG: KH domain-containing protein [Firmicutes bacterium]|nr:KH domain-containing protein [Bacillota bacterium]